ncbi:peptide chain release factor N(5)-glutamine methyltransferase [Daejeonella sp.]|uniref:peptide chain release factor N(5)-glutamine methyltransferase n=1 Tax=Daejeonella sp. TaxID=2805397 RepID=UPI0025C31B7F|nr:peptide chain release factor N(5)-glutamine methyltransferase [Daejeonella sp.]
MTFIQLEKEFIDALSTIYDSQEAKSLTWLSINAASKLERAKYLSMRDEEIPAADLEKLLEILEQLKIGLPLQYILGETEFYDLKFKVNPSVLIPRPETEELVDWALITIREMKGETEVLKIVDLGTGSGCIPISIKKYIPLADISAIDISKEALNTAKQNAEINNTEIKFLEDDILNPTSQELINNQYDLIISNPPYVTDSEKLEMHQNVLNHEPHSALFVPDNEALKFYVSIADFALNHLNKNGFLFLEINKNLGKETGELLTKQGFKTVEIRQDMYGKDRMIKASL